MCLWQQEAAEKMVEFIHSCFQIDSYDFVGSMLDSNSLDVFSDVDICFCLSDNSALDATRLVNLLSERFCSVLGYETHISDDECILRICFENGWRFDLVFIYPKSNECLHVESSPDRSVNDVINQFWFLSSLVLVKLGRKDFLIAAHLALELCRLTIVLQMLVRDMMKNSNIHRFGDSEDVPILHALTQIEESASRNEILCVLYKAAEQVDKLSLSHFNIPEQTDTLRNLQRIFNI